MFGSRFKSSSWLGPAFSTAASTLNHNSSAVQENQALAADADEEVPTIEEGPLMPDLRRLEHRSESPPSCPQPSTPQDPPIEYPFHSKMPTTSPIDIATPTRNASSSPASQAHQNNSKFLELDSRTSAMMSAGYDSSMGGGRQDSFSGAKPISMNNPNRNTEGRTRRESFGGSLVGGMSWGGVSVGSWIRDDIMMTGTSPFPMQSPSYHSASYMPKLEANFMRDFSCCGLNLPNLHDLLQHYEEMHAQQSPQSLRAAASAPRSRDNSTTTSGKADMANQPSSTQIQSAQQQQNHASRPSGLQIPQNAPPVGGISLLRQQPQSQPVTPIQKTMQTIPDDSMDGVEDMEMDDAISSMNQTPDTPIQQTQHTAQVTQQSLFGQPPRPQLNMNANGMQYSGLRTSQPTTPATSGYGFQHNPTVSSVNTPTLSTQPMQQSPFPSHSSVPGTPGELDDDFTSFPMNLNTGIVGNQQYPFGFGGNEMGLDLCIDEPARRLYQPNGGGQQSQKAMAQQFAQFGLGQGQVGNTSDFVQAYQHQQQQQQQMMNMTGMTPQQAALAVMLAEEHKPFKCPVVGCEKAYKNQNGLKYHKAHGHQTQQLHENGDGTFSIVNPETSIPYQGEAGMAKEKPYRCDVCGKRYKNLNGLKYHKQHSPPCNPDLKLTSHMVAAGLGGLNGLNINVAGLPGIGEEGM